MKSTDLVSMLLAAILVLSVPTSSRAFLGAFWLGVDAKVQTTVKIDQNALDTINNLPLEARKQAIIAANEVFAGLDQTVRDNAKLLGTEIERVSLQAAIQWECTAKNVVDKLFTEVRSVLPSWNLFPDRCERRYVPDKVGPGPAEKVKIAACWIYDALPEYASPDVISTKMATLQLMSADAACRLRETQAASELWRETADYGQKYVTWLELRGVCEDPKSCAITSQTAIAGLLSTADPRDVDQAPTRLSKARSLTAGADCRLPCYEASLVLLHLAGNEVRRNQNLREMKATELAKLAISNLQLARKSVIDAKRLALQFNTLQQSKVQYDQAQAKATDARNAASDARATAASIAGGLLAAFDQNDDEVIGLLSDVTRIVGETTKKENQRQVAVEAAKQARIMRQIIKMKGWLGV